MKFSKVQSPRAEVQGPESKVQGPGAGSSRNFGLRTLGIGLRPSNFGDREGVALVITLIMLAIITFMAVTFLVLSQRERSSVTTALDQKTARNASDAGLARVSAELLTRIMLHTNFQDFDLLVSTNYFNLNGLQGGDPVNLSPTNVNYGYLVGGGALGSQDRNINIASLLYNPRPPVYVTVPSNGTNISDFRFYLDLNRNGRFDQNGSWPVVVADNAGKLWYVNSTNGAQVSTNLPIPVGTILLTNIFVGDPEWIGQLERPEELHSADNRFVARYAYIVVPVGKTLDINTMHNQALNRSLLFPNSDGYLRNQGVGPWELNLPAFLVDLNTNIWYAKPNPPQNQAYYQYNRGDVNFPGPNKGIAFQDAFSLLNYRYNFNYNSLATAAQTFPSAGAALQTDNIDEYSDGPLMLTLNTNENILQDPVTQPWPGSENTNHYFTTQDLFDRSKSSVLTNFSTRLQQAGGGNDSYNAYTFYRMLAQLGTDSTVDQTKLNINYKNTDIHGNIVPGMETNLYAWPAEDFFTNAANRILGQISNQLGVALSTGHIPLYPTNYYTPAVHRALQLAANIYDSTTNRALISGQTNAFYPSVFRPVFMSQNGEVWINGFKEVTDTNALLFQFWDMNTASNNSGTHAGINIYGVPWVIGAKKGFPAFNEYAMETAMNLQRKLKLFKTKENGPVTDVRQMFELGISNTLAVEAWNSYLTAYPRALSLGAGAQVGISISNQFGTSLIPSGWTSTNFSSVATSIGANTWRPFVNQSQANGSIIVPLQSGAVFLTNSTYLDHGAASLFIPQDPAAFLTEASNAMPELYVTITNRVQFSLVDTTVGRVIDFVNFEEISTTNISAAARGLSQCGSPGVDPLTYWCPRLQPNSGYTPGISLNEGINYQIGVSQGVPPLTRAQWVAAGADPNNFDETTSFKQFLNRNGNTNLFMQTPFNPTARLYRHTTWQVNDPLVHYTIGDLTDPAKAVLDTVTANPPLDNIGRLNTRYRPWGGYINNSDPKTDYNVSLKDPNLTQSADWDFPTNKLPNLGWLGRVHRGTPWQTVYMKSPQANLDDWKLWSGNAFVAPNKFQDANLTTPIADYQLFDLFTTGPSPSAARGQLNINQTNLAAWSAVLSGVAVLTNTLGGAVGPAVIQPAGVYDPNNPSAVVQIVQGINNARANTNLFRNQTFQHLGDVLSAPQLTIASPFLNTNNPVPKNPSTLPGINDEIMERIPQQIMSLLTLNQTPRFVIYSFGQTLHPASDSLVKGGTFNGLCTNYQITAESAVRAVVRMEGTPDPQYIDGKVDSQGRTYPPHLVVEQFNVLGPD